MRGKACINFRKLSSCIDSASLDHTRKGLSALRRLNRLSSAIGDDISHLVENMRGVTAQDNEPFVFTTVLAENRVLLQAVLRSCADARFRDIRSGSLDALIVYLEGLTDTEAIEELVLKPLLTVNLKAGTSVRHIANTLLPIASLELSNQPSTVIKAVLSGKPLLFLDGSAECIVLDAEKYVKRAITTGETEGAIRGPKDAFTETLKDNLVLVRRRTRDPNLKVETLEVGLRSKTTVAVVYCSTLVKPGLVEEVKRRLDEIRTDQILLANTIEDFIVDHPWNPFPQAQGTESPTKVVAALYDGRVAIFTDNTPHCMLVPCTMGILIQTTEDFATTPLAASLLRLTRFAAAFAAIYLPAIYIGVVSYHPGLLPTSLAIAIAQLRASTPFPAILEALIMEALLEVFQEAIVRLPNKIAGAAGIVGALVIGTTIVQAGIVNPLLVVIMATAALSSYTMTGYNLALALRVYRIPLIAATAVLGLYGLVLGAWVITVNLCAMRSFGESYLGGLFNTRFVSDWKDQIFRVPAPLMKTRSKELGAKKLVRTENKP